MSRDRESSMRDYIRFTGLGIFPWPGEKRRLRRAFAESIKGGTDLEVIQTGRDELRQKRWDEAVDGLAAIDRTLLTPKAVAIVERILRENGRLP